MIEDLSIITIPATEDTPEIVLDSVNYTLRIKGASFENHFETFEPVMKWLSNIKDKTNKIVCIFEFTIISSTSNKILIDVFHRLNEIYHEGKIVHVKWHFDYFDEDMKEEGESLALSVSFPVEYVSM